MADHKINTLVVGAFAAALAAMSATPASAQEFTEAQKKIQAEHTALVKSGKVEPCFVHRTERPERLLCGCGHHLRRHEHCRLSR